MSDPYAHGTVLNTHITAMEAKISGKRYCTSCQATKPVEAGKLRGTRWICGTCLQNLKNRTKSTLYMRKK